eukprot:4444814-Pleurochrysis_carterae.AAC.1
MSAPHTAAPSNIDSCAERGGMPSLYAHRSHCTLRVVLPRPHVARTVSCRRLPKPFLHCVSCRFLRPFSTACRVALPPLRVCVPLRIT